MDRGRGRVVNRGTGIVTESGRDVRCVAAEPPTSFAALAAAGGAAINDPALERLRAQAGAIRR